MQVSYIPPPGCLGSSWEPMGAPVSGTIWEPLGYAGSPWESLGSVRARGSAPEQQRLRSSQELPRDPKGSQGITGQGESQWTGIHWGGVFGEIMGEGAAQGGGREGIQGGGSHLQIFPYLSTTPFPFRGCLNTNLLFGKLPKSKLNVWELPDS